MKPKLSRYIVIFPGITIIVWAKGPNEALRKAEDELTRIEQITRRGRDSTVAIVVKKDEEGEEIKFFIRGKEVSGKTLRNHFVKSGRERSLVNLIRRSIKSGVTLDAIKKSKLI